LSSLVAVVADPMKAVVAVPVVMWRIKTSQ
jgi:hypothetical protein